MITILRTVLNTNRLLVNKKILSNTVKLNSLLVVRKLTDLKPNENNLLVDQGQSQSLETENNLLISEEFKEMLNEKLRTSNFKNLPYKQDEFNNLIYKIENPFNLYYLYEQYSKEFNHFNLINFIKRLGYLSKNTDFLKFNDQVLIPNKIKTLMTKQLIKNVRFFEPNECFSVFLKLPVLGFKLNDYSVKAMLQILKFHLNELELNEIIRIKIALDSLKAESGESNEYADVLEKGLDLAVQIKYDQLKNPSHAVRLLKNFPNSISEPNFEKIISFIYLKFHIIFLVDCKDLIKILAERNYIHLKLLQKISNKILNSTDENYLIANQKDNIENSVVNYLNDFSNSFLKLKYYESSLIDFIADKQMIFFKNSINNQKDFCFQIMNTLLESCITFKHKKTEILDLLADSSLFNEEKFPIASFLNYSCLLNYEKLTQNDFEKLVEIFNSQSHTDDIKMQVIKSLCWMNQNELAKQVLDGLKSSENLPILDKAFINQIFKINYLKYDEKLLSKSRLEESIEKAVNEIDNNRFEMVEQNINYNSLNYFFNYVIIDKTTNKKCYVQIGNVGDSFRNVKENTNHYIFKKKYILDLIEKENENSLYWIIEPKKFYNLKEDDLKKNVEKNLKYLYERN